MGETRYNELLGLSPEIADPDYYQLLEIERGWVDAAQVEERFKQQMSKLQQIHSPKHKEFIEFLKGELKKARAILTDPMRRDRYDGEVKAERVAELRRLAAHMLIDRTLSQQGEISLVEEGKRIGLEIPDVKRVIEEEVKRLGATRVTSKRTDARTQAAAIEQMRSVARQAEDARITARFAEAKAKHAEHARERAEEQALLALKKAKEAQAMARQTVVRGSLAAAVDEQEREALEGEIKQLRTELEERLKELDALRTQLEAERSELEQARLALERSAARSQRMERMVLAISLTIGAALLGHALRIFVPGAPAWLEEAGIWSVRAGAGAAAGVVGGLGLALMAISAWLAGRPARGPFIAAVAPLVLLALAAGAVYLT